MCQKKINGTFTEHLEVKSSDPAHDGEATNSGDTPMSSVTVSTNVQRQTAVTAYFSSKQLLLFVFAYSNVYTAQAVSG